MENYKKDELDELNNNILVEININFCNKILNNLIKKKKNK